MHLNKASICHNHKYDKYAFINDSFHSLLQGVFPDIFKISEVWPAAKGGQETDPSNNIIARFLRCLFLSKYLKSLSVSNL